MSKEVIKETLRNFGLTEKEAEIYLFIAKYGAQTSGEIAKKSKTHRPHIYRIIKRLQKKGVIESTLESPARFTITPFERIIDNNIKAKHQEAVLLEKAKDSLLTDWKNIRSNSIAVSYTHLRAHET